MNTKETFPYQPGFKIQVSVEEISRHCYRSYGLEVPWLDVIISRPMGTGWCKLRITRYIYGEFHAQGATHQPNVILWAEVNTLGEVIVIFDARDMPESTAIEGWFKGTLILKAEYQWPENTIKRFRDWEREYGDNGY